KRAAAFLQGHAVLPRGYENRVRIARGRRDAVERDARIEPGAAYADRRRAPAHGDGFGIALAKEPGERAHAAFRDAHQEITPVHLGSREAHVFQVEYGIGRNG